MAGPWEQFQQNKAAQGGPWLKFANPVAKPPKSGTFATDVIDNFKQGIQSGKDLLSGNYEDIGRPRITPKTQALADKLFPEGSQSASDGTLDTVMGAVHNIGNTVPSDWSGALNEKIANSPEGKALKLIGGTNPVWNIAGTAINRYAMPAVSNATGIAPDNLQLLAMLASPFGLKQSATMKDPNLAIAKGVVNTAGAAKQKLFGSGTAEQADAAMQKYVAKTLQKEGIAPEEVAQRIQAASDAGVPLTLPEASGSSTLLQNQKNIERGAGESANIMRDFKAERPGQIRDTLGDFTKDIVDTAEQTAKPLYDTAREIQIPRDKFRELLQDPVIADAVTEFGKNKALFYKVENTKPYSVGYLDEVKKYINSQSKKNASDPYLATIYNDAAKKITGTLDPLAPQYAKAREASQPGIVAKKQIGKAIGETQDNSIGVLRNRIFGSPNRRAELERGLGKDNFNNLDTIMGYVDDAVKGGVGGSDTAFNLRGAEQLSANTGAKGIGLIVHPIQAITKFADWYGNKVRQKDYTALAKIFTAEDVQALGRQLQDATPTESTGIVSSFLQEKLPAIVNEPAKVSYRTAAKAVVPVSTSKEKKHPLSYLSTRPARSNGLSALQNR